VLVELAGLVGAANHNGKRAMVRPRGALLVYFPISCM
jgi:hypothetical protein